MKTLIQKIRKAFAIFFVSIRAFFDRNWHLLFNKEKCVKIFFQDNWFRYNDIVNDGTNDLRCLGKGWYKLHEC